MTSMERDMIVTGSSSPLAKITRRMKSFWRRVPFKSTSNKTKSGVAPALLDSEIKVFQNEQVEIVRNDRININQLPIEILIKIILFTAPYSFSIHTPYPFMVYSWVCRYWRLAVVDNAVFWKIILIRLNVSPTFLEVLLERSRHAPLTLILQSSSPSQLYAFIIHHLSEVGRRVKTVHLNIVPYFHDLRDILSLFPSLENILCHPNAYFPTKLSFIPPCVRPRVQAIQIRLPNLKKLALPRYLSQLRWLSLAYETESVHLSPFLESLEGLPNLQFLHLTRSSKPGQVGGTEGLTRTITFPELIVLITNCPIIHLIDAPKLSHLDVYVVYPQPVPVKDTYGHLCGFDFLKITHLHFDGEHGTALGNPTHKWKDFENVTWSSSGKSHRCYESSSTKWISDEDLDLTAYYPNRFKLSFRPFWLSIFVVYLEKATNLVEITLEAFHAFYFDHARLDTFSNALRLATTVRNLTILPGYGSELQTLFDLLSDGSLLPRLEKLRYIARYDRVNPDHTRTFDSLRNLVNRRSERCPVHLEIELNNFDPKSLDMWKSWHLIKK